MVVKFLLEWYSIDHSYINRDVLFNKQLRSSPVSAARKLRVSAMLFTEPLNIENIISL